MSVEVIRPLQSPIVHDEADAITVIGGDGGFAINPAGTILGVGESFEDSGASTQDKRRIRINHIYASGYWSEAHVTNDDS